jgi:hypothetical protein
MSFKDSYYRKLSAVNRLIAETRERIETQQALLIEKVDRSGGVESVHRSVQLLSNLKRSLRLLLHSRAMLIEVLMRWPNYHR